MRNYLIFLAFFSCSSTLDSLHLHALHRVCLNICFEGSSTRVESRGPESRLCRAKKTNLLAWAIVYIFWKENQKLSMLFSLLFSRLSRHNTQRVQLSASSLVSISQSFLWVTLIAKLLAYNSTVPQRVRDERKASFSISQEVSFYKLRKKKERRRCDSDEWELAAASGPDPVCSSHDTRESWGLPSCNIHSKARRDMR